MIRGIHRFPSFCRPGRRKGNGAHEQLYQQPGHQPAGHGRRSPAGPRPSLGGPESWENESINEPLANLQGGEGYWFCRNFLTIPSAKHIPVEQYMLRAIMQELSIQIFIPIMHIQILIMQIKV